MSQQQQQQEQQREALMALLGLGQPNSSAKRARDAAFPQPPEPHVKAPRRRESAHTEDSRASSGGNGGPGGDAAAALRRMPPVDPSLLQALMRVENPTSETLLALLRAQAAGSARTSTLQQHMNNHRQQQQQQQQGRAPATFGLTQLPRDALSVQVPPPHFPTLFKLDSTTSSGSSGSSTVGCFSPMGLAIMSPAPPQQTLQSRTSELSGCSVPPSGRVSDDDDARDDGEGDQSHDNDEDDDEDYDEDDEPVADGCDNVGRDAESRSRSSSDGSSASGADTRSPVRTGAGALAALPQQLLRPHAQHLLLPAQATPPSATASSRLGGGGHALLQQRRRRGALAVRGRTISTRKRCNACKTCTHSACGACNNCLNKKKRKRSCENRLPCMEQLMLFCRSVFPEGQLRVLAAALGSLPFDGALLRGAAAAPLAIIEQRRQEIKDLRKALSQEDKALELLKKAFGPPS